MTALERVPAVGGTRTVPAPDPIARDYILLGAPPRPAHPGARRRVLRPGRPQGDRGHGPAPRAGPPARRRGRAAGPPAGRGDRTRPARLARPPAGRPSRPRPPRWPATRCRTSSTSTRCFAYAPPRIPDARFEAAAATIDGLLPGDAPLADRLTAWDARFVVDVDRLPARRRVAGRALPGDGGRRFRPARRRGPAGLARHRSAVERLQLVRRRPALAGRRQHRPAGPRDRPRSGWSPTRRTRATTSSTPGRRPSSWTGRSPRVVDPPHQHARVPHQRGTGRPRRPLRRSARRSGRPPGRDPRARRPADRRRSGRGARGGDARGRARRAPPRARRRSAGNAAILRHADGRSHDEVLAYLHGGRPLLAGRSPRSASNSSSIRCGGRTSSSTPRARRSSVAGSTRSRTASGRRGSTGCSASS